MESDALVKVEENGDIVFEPVSNSKNIGFIFYPGAKVESSAYATIAKEIASNGYTVIIAKMNFNLTILSPNRVDSVISDYENIDTWVIGRHSLGGVMESNYALENDKIKGGNHGDFGHQKGDGESSITNKQQMMDTSKYIIELLDSLNGSLEES